jgi:hypothetical protein
MEAVNIFSSENAEGRLDVARAMGSTEMAMFVYDIPPGQASSPYHYSSSRVPAVSVYPDSDKIAVWPGEESDELIFRRGSAVPWSDGEEGWERAV